MKKFSFLLAIVMIMTLVLSACAPKAETPEEEVTEEVGPTEELAVGIVLPTKDEPRWIQDQTRFEDKLGELGYDAEILFSQADPSQEKANVETLITQGVKVIILCPHDSAAAAASAEAARDAGVTVISYDRLITDTDAVDYYVTFDSVAVGEAQAQYLVDKVEGEGNPLYLYAGAATDNNAFLFFEGAWNVLQPKIADGTFYVVNSSEAVALQDKAELTRDEMGKIISQITTNWDFDDAKSLAEANLTAAAAEDKGDVFILAPNDGTARAIADAFGADTDISSYVVTGQDAEIASIQYIIDGKQSMTVLKDVRNLVSDAVDTAVAVAEGKAVTTTGEYDNGVIMVPAIQSEVITVDQSNVVSAIIDSGYWDASEFTGLDELAGEPVEEGPAPFEGVTIDFWHVYSEGPGEAMQALIDEFNETNAYGITVQGFNQGNYSDVEDKINAGIQSGDLPDVVMGYTNALTDWYSVDSIIDLTPYVEDAEYGLTTEELDDLYPHLRVAGTTPDGAWVAYPLTQSANVLVYNFTWAEELGFTEPPKTSAELREQVCAAAAANEEIGGDYAGTGGLVYYPSATNWLHFLYAFGGNELNEDETAYEFNKQAAIDASMFINDMKADGCVWQTESYPNPEQAQRKALITMSSTAGLYYYQVAFENEGNDDEWGFIAAPGPDGQMAVDAFQQMLGVVPSTQEREMASWLFIKWLTSPEIQARWVVGATGYYGTQYTTEALLADYAEENPVWATGVELAAIGPSEPQTFPAWSAVRSAIGDTAAELYNAADAAEVEAILDALTITANELVEEIQ